MLLIDVLRSYMTAGKFRIHDFVVMPNHLPVLLTVGQNMTIEKAMQLIKGGFSYRLKKESGYLGKCGNADFQKCESGTRRVLRGVGSTSPRIQ